MMDIRAKLREWSLDRSLARNVASLYGVQFANYLLPLVTIPYLTRVLGPATWGLVAFAQAFGAYASIVIEYGFHLSATRAVASSRDSRSELANLVAGVMGAKVVLAAGAVILAVLLESWIPLFRAHPVFLWAAVFWAVGQSFSMLWYYQGFERMRLVAVLDVVGKAAATAGIFILIHHPADGWKVLVLQGSGALLSVVVATALVYREVPFRLPTWRLVSNTLRMGWSMFLFQGSMSLYGAGNAFILGLFASPAAVGFYAGAEKLARALMGLLAPIHQSLYPRLSHLVQHDRPAANRLARSSMFLMSLGRRRFESCRLSWSALGRSPDSGQELRSLGSGARNHGCLAAARRTGNPVRSSVDGASGAGPPIQPGDPGGWGAQPGSGRGFRATVCAAWHGGSRGRNGSFRGSLPLPHFAPQETQPPGGHPNGPGVSSPA